MDIAMSKDIIRLGAKETISKTNVIPYMIENVTRALIAILNIGSINNLTLRRRTDKRANARGRTIPSIKAKSDSILWM